jgi:hypothetical protein
MSKSEYAFSLLRITFPFLNFVKSIEMQRFSSLLVFTIILILNAQSYAQSLEWAHGTGGTSGSITDGVEHDSLGNIYLVGQFAGPTDFDPGPGVATLASPGTDIDVFVVKYDPLGNYLWAINMGGIYNDRGQTMKVTPSGDIYIAGVFTVEADLDPSPATANLLGAINDDIFLAKYDTDGNYIWAKEIGGTGIDRSFSIDLDSAENIYMTGFFSGTADFIPGAGVSNLISNGGKDIFIAKYDSSGAYQWAYGMGGINDDDGKYLTLDETGSIYITGYYSGTTDFDITGGTLNRTAVGGEDIFVAKYDNAANLLWVNSMGGSSDDFGQAVDVDAAGSVYAVGVFEDTIDLDPGAGNVIEISEGFHEGYIVKFDDQGNWLWSTRIGGTDYDEIEAVHIDRYGDIYFSGNIGANVDFYPGPGEVELSVLGTYEGFVAKYDSDGNYIWARSTLGTAFVNVREMTTDTLGNLYITGSNTGIADFDFDAGTLNLGGNGSTDFFLAKYSICGTFYNQLDSTAICQGNTHTFHDGNTATVDTTHVSIFASVSGCDSVIRTTLDVISPVLTSQPINLCNGDSFFAQGNYQTVGGTYMDTLAAMSSCDSIISTTLTVNPPLFSNAATQICTGDSIILGGIYQQAAGLYTDTLGGSSGCDSLIYTTLTVLLPMNNNVPQAICSGDSILLAGTYQTAAGTYTDIFASAQGCDSLVHTALTINPNVSANATATICEGNTVMLGGALQNSAGTYMDTLISSIGCDSVITTVLSVLQVDSSSSTSQTICPTDSVLINGVYENTSGVYYDVFTGVNGCDSIVEFTLSVTPIDVTVTASGDTLFAVAGYDSYQWIDCDNNMIVSGALGSSFVPDSSGNYMVEIGFMGCVIQSSCMTVNLVGIASRENAPLARVFPNPTTGLLNIVAVGTNSIISLKLFDVTGKLVHSNAGDQWVIDLSALPTGLYLLQVELIDGNHAGHIVKF